MDCVFCRIVAGSEPASVVYEDEATLAFMNLRQANPGHVLVIPKAHTADVCDLDEQTAGRILRTVVRVARAVRTALGPEGLTVFQCNGEAAEQEVPHVHFSVLPRRRNDGLMKVYPEAPAVVCREELDGLAARIRTAM